MSLTDSVDVIYRQYRLRVMLAITLGYGFLYTCRLALSVVKKPLIDNGIFSVEELGMIGAAMLYGYAFGKLINGVLADHVSPRLFFAIGILMSALVNLSMSMSTVVWISIALWGLNGWFQSFGAPASVISLTNWFGPHERGRYYGIWSASHAVGEGLTFYVTAAIVAAWGWRAGFIAPGLFCVCVAGGVYAAMRNSPTSLGLPRIQEWLDDSWEDDGISRTAASTWIVQKTVFLIPAMWVVAVSSALMYVTRYGINSWGVLYLQEIRGYTLLEAGLFLSVNTIAGIIGSVAFGFISDKFFDARRPPANFIFAFVEVIALLLIFFGPKSVPLLAFAFALYGAGLSGLIASVGGLFAVDIAPGRAAGAALGFVGIFSYVGAALQENVSAALISSGTTIIDGVRIYNFDSVILFWIGSSVLSMLLAATLWNAKVRD
jgi:OPA family sugar phosphate sensor protein UhpC-like MFS transporter